MINDRDIARQMDVGASPRCVLSQIAILSLDQRRDLGDIIALKTIILTSKAAKELDALPAPARGAVNAALVAYATRGLGDVKKLQGVNGFRLRVGDYRVLFAEDQITVLAVGIGRRTTTTYRRP